MLSAIVNIHPTVWQLLISHKALFHVLCAEHEIARVRWVHNNAHRVVHYTTLCAHMHIYCDPCVPQARLCSIAIYWQEGDTIVCVTCDTQDEHIKQGMQKLGDRPFNLFCRPAKELNSRRCILPDNNWINVFTRPDMYNKPTLWLVYVTACNFDSLSVLCVANTVSKH